MIGPVEGHRRDDEAVPFGVGLLQRDALAAFAPIGGHDGCEFQLWGTAGHLDEFRLVGAYDKGFGNERYPQVHPPVGSLHCLEA